jgi:hypothetical protein
MFCRVPRVAGGGGFEQYSNGANYGFEGVWRARFGAILFAMWLSSS